MIPHSFAHSLLSILVCCFAPHPWALNASEKSGITTDRQQKGPPVRQHLNISRQQSIPAPAPVLVEAYRQLQAGNLAQAEENYARHLSSEPHHVDALLGMAVIAQRRGQRAKSEHWYQQAIAASPGNSHAQAGIISLHGISNPQVAESQLLQALDTHADSAPLNFALGNLHASQKRWSEARLAYARALAADTDNPDYAYNLAVSLDRLDLTEEAEKHYRHALSVSGHHAGSFDREKLAVRLAWQAVAPAEGGSRKK